jgi:predicted site-specific integrase-resolvase
MTTAIRSTNTTSTPEKTTLLIGYARTSTLDQKAGLANVRASLEFALRSVHQ